LLKEVVMLVDEGETETVKSTAPENPPVGDAVTVYEVGVPAFTVLDGGLELRVKSPAAWEIGTARMKIMIGIRPRRNSSLNLSITRQAAQL